MENSTTALMEIDVGNSKMSFQTFLDSQKDLFHTQIDQLQKIVVTQCKLTGVNPLSQEMAAGALSINIGKRPRDLLNPKAVKYMQSVFSIKDTISKKESREISALCGVTITQVREYFASQRSRVRKHVRLAREKATKSDVSKTSLDVCSTSSDPATLAMDPAPLNSLDPTPLNSVDPAPLNSMDPAPLNSMDPSPLNYVDPAPLNSVVPKAVEEAPSCSSQQETIPGIDASDKNFVDNIFNLMRKEETFSGQMKLMEWILQIQNPSVLNWFLTKEGLMILTVWLSQAAVEEQTTVLHVVLKVLCHLPLHKALPFQVSAIIQNVNRLRFYRTSDISNRAKVLLTRLSKILIRNAALKKPSPNSLNDAQKETIHKKRTRLMIENQWPSNIDLPEDVLALTLESSENCRKSEPQQALKLLTASADDSTRENNRGVSSSQTRERRKVLLVEQPGRNTNGRSGQVARAVTSNHARPMSADDIKKAKMRAMFMQSKRGKSVASSNETRQPKIEVLKRPSPSQTSHLVSAPKSPVRPEIEENSNPAVLATKTSPTLPIAETSPTLRITETSATLPIAKTITTPPIAETSPTLPEALIDSNLSLGPPEPSLEKLKRDQISWQMPPEIIVNNLWSVGAGENSKEVEIQTGRIRREKETIYQRIQDIPSNPKDPWDREMDYDDTLTPEIPTEQPPDAAVEISSSPRYNATMAVASTSASNPLPITPVSTAGSDNLPEPDLELLAVLLKNPELVFALTSGQGNNLTSADTVRLLDMIKTNGINLAGVSNGLGGNPSGKAEVMTSLPSPTPSSEPRMTQWRSEVANDGFSQPSLVGARESSVFSVAAATSTLPSLSGQLPAAVATHLVQPQTSTTNYLPQLPVNTTSTHHLRAINPEDHLYMGLNQLSTQLSGINQVQQHQPTISSLHQNNLVAAGLPLLQQETVNYGQIQNVKAAPISIHINPPKDMPSALLPIPPQRQQQQQPHLLSEQQMLQPSQTGWQWNNPSSYNSSSSSSSRQNGYEGSSVSNPGLYQSNQNNNYNVFYPPVGQLRTPPYLPGSTTWERNNEYMDETDLETWSPERSFGYQSSSGFYSTEPRRGSGGRNWSSGRRRDSDGYRDNRNGGGGRGGGGRRWRDRRH